MFANVLIANRGEIACRIIATARRMGMRTIALATPADRGPLFTRLADETHEIGAGSEGYLDAKSIVALAKRVGAQCLHPGYGFLSENADFAEACREAGVVFVGPSPEAMRAMGLKSSAKALMAKAGAPIVPGYHGDNQSPKFLKEKAYEIGYPVLIKAIAGGGGRGMRRVDAHVDFEAALDSAMREAEGAFGDSRVLIEKYVSAPRHVEVQVFGDRHGGVVHLFERDCSLQRRHQKVIEETPAPGLPEETRAAMCEAAVAAAYAVGYVGAGTVEFIRGFLARARAGQFLFLGDEYAPSGRASRHRGDHGARSRRMAVSGRRGRAAAARPRPDSAQAAGRSRRASTRRIPRAASCLRRARSSRSAWSPARACGSTRASKRGTA